MDCIAEMSFAFTHWTTDCWHYYTGKPGYLDTTNSSLQWETMDKYSREKLCCCIIRYLVLKTYS